MGGWVLRLISEAVSARPGVVKPLVLLAAKVMGPGPLRLKMVKFAHEPHRPPKSPREALTCVPARVDTPVGTPAGGGVSKTDGRLWPATGDRAGPPSGPGGAYPCTPSPRAPS